jgi:hypothetical protein
MRAALLAMALTLAASAPQAAAHPAPQSTVIVQVEAGAVELVAFVPITELKAATDDAPAAEAGAYVARHAAVTGADGRAWPVEVRAVEPGERDAVAVMAVTLAFRPAAGATGRPQSLRYDAVNHRIASHHVRVYRRVGDEVIPLGRLQSPTSELALP